MVELYTILVAVAAIASHSMVAVQAFPAFNTPNSVDVHGQTCPLVDRPGLTCPVMCVQDFADCPSAVAVPQCKSNEQLCDDGACHGSCADVVNPCLCAFDASQVATVYKACPGYTNKVTVPAYDPSIKQAQLELACAIEWGMVGANTTVGMGSGVAEWSVDARDKMVWDVCPVPLTARLTYTESFCLAFYGIMGAELVLFALWHLYKRVRERHAVQLRQLCSPLPTTVAADEKTVSETQSEEQSEYTVGDLPEGMMLLRGFDNNMFGAGLFYLALLTTAGWVVLLAVIVSDYYGKITGGVAYGMLANSNQSMAVFIFVWHLAALWLAGMLACMHTVRNYFRIECPLPEARVVQVEERRAEVVMMEGSENRLTALANRVRNKLVGRLRLDVLAESCTANRVEIGGETRTFIEYHCTRYVLDGASGRFQCNAFDLGNTHRALLASRNGLSSTQAADRASRIGVNYIHVAVPSFPMAMLAEVFSYFYLYQMMCMWVWFYFNYFKMALVQFGVILVSAVIKVVIRLKSERKVKALAEHRSVCRVKRNNEWQEIDTAELVPGDVIAVESGMEVMCDGCVLAGEIVVDESSLTGEAMPVRKFALKNDTIPYDASGSGKTYSLFAGTKVLQCTGSTYASPSQSQPTLMSSSSEIKLEKAVVTGTPAATLQEGEPETQVLVTATRTLTDKGKLIQRILFPARYSFVFDEQLRVALLILLAYGGVAFALTIWLMGHDVTSWFYGVFVISEIMSPLLPAALVVGQSVAADRLRRANIFCVDLPRIMMAGKVQVFCFDKTGTLTKEGLEYFAVQEISDGRFHGEEQDMARLPHVTQVGFASCHAVTMVGDKLIGNPVDVEQFRATDWEILAGTREDHLDTLISPFLESHAGGKEKRKTVHVIKRFEFAHARQSMSVAVRDPDTGHVHVFVKGSFERLKRIAKSASVPGNYDAVTAKWAKEGCYVLALAHKDLGDVDVNTLTREQMEGECELVSLLLFRNKLKEDTESAIMELKAGDTRAVMITGDTALTGVYIARQCSMISPTARVLLGDIEQGQLVWRDTVTDEAVDADKLLHEERVARDEAERALFDVVAKRTPLVELAVTAAAFDYLVEAGKIRQYLLDIRIFARMTPQGKVDCVQLHMERCVTAMCGDGGNDCGALRAAHVGLALSESEASIVSPFSSSNRSIHSCVTLLRQGRAALATSFAGYKFLINYATTMSMLELTQFYFSVIVPEAVWIMVDSFIAVGLCIAVTQAQTARKLAPSRPTARLLGAHTLASIWGQTVINYAFLFGMLGLLYRQSWFRCHEFDSRDIDTSLWWLLGDNYEAEIISIVCLFQFINGGAVYNFGYKYRRAWLTNYLMVVMYFGMLAVVSVLTLANPNRFSCLFRINCGDSDSIVAQGYPKPSWNLSEYNSPNGHNILPWDFRWTLWGCCLANIVLCNLYEKFVILGPVGRVVKNWWTKRHGDNKLKVKL